MAAPASATNSSSVKYRYLSFCQYLLSIRHDLDDAGLPGDKRHGRPSRAHGADEHIRPAYDLELLARGDG